MRNPFIFAARQAAATAIELAAIATFIAAVAVWAIILGG
jgi:Flp pilus assembly pilin Flp